MSSTGDFGLTMNTWGTSLISEIGVKSVSGS